MNFLALPEEDRPALPTRERLAGKCEVQCPGCDAWRPGFTLVETVDGWRCDGCRTAAAREGANE